jgi:phosphohistidine swiveling domain-containing protein
MPETSLATRLAVHDAVFPLLGSAAFTAAAGGRKAAPLHDLLVAGFRVPPGFVVPPELELTDSHHQELELMVAAIGGYPVAARSSGHLEDLPGASFAGQYVTHLEIRSTPALVNAIRDCRASARSPQVVAYLQKNRLDESQARVSVLVQRMVDAAVAGVAFSVHPTTGREDHALVECCRGLGEKLVSGRTAPTRYVLNLADTSVVEHDPGAEQVDLAPGILTELRARVLDLQAHFGAPQDIEWAVDADGALWILQSRPITRIQWRSDIPEFTTADFREGGVAARVCTPLMYSLYRDAVQQSMQRYFVDIRLLPKDAPQQTWIDMFYGRPYWSASAVKTALLKVPGFDEELFDKDLGIQKRYGDSGPLRTPTSLRTVLPAIPVAIALERNYRRHLRLTADYRRRFLPLEARYLRLAGSFGQMRDADFFSVLADVLAFHLQTEGDYFTTIYNNANFQSDLKKLLRRIAAAIGEEISAVALMSGLQDVSHMKMQRDLVYLVGVARRNGVGSAAWNGELEAFLSANYFHGDAELDLSVPRWGERPERVRQMIEDILRSGIDPKDPDRSAQAQFEAFAAEEARVLRAIRRAPWRRLRFERRFRRQLKLARTYLSRREEMREYSTRAYNVVRQFVLEAGARLKKRGYLRDSDDVFMLQTEELTQLEDRSGGPSGPRGRDDVLATTAYRRLMYRGYRLLEPPGELGRNVSHRATADLQTVSDHPVLTGIGCSAGIVVAPVRVVATLDEAHTLQAGEILVTRFTDPGWTPVLGLVSGIVTEVGGLLSHAAVIGREYGIPAVLNVPGATHLLRTGQRVEIDGSRGTVTVIPDDHA